MASFAPFTGPERVRPIGGPGAIQFNSGDNNEFTGTQDFKYMNVIGNDIIYVNGDITTNGIYMANPELNSDISNPLYIEGQVVGLSGGGIAIEQVAQDKPTENGRGTGIQLTSNITRIQSLSGKRVILYSQGDYFLPDPETNPNGDGATVYSTSGSPFGLYRIVSNNDYTLSSGSGHGRGQKSGNIRFILPESLDSADDGAVLFIGLNSLSIQNGPRKYIWPPTTPTVGQYLEINTITNTEATLGYN